jgi:hypothetical protein
MWEGDWMKDQRTEEHKTKGTHMQQQRAGGGIAILLWQVLACFGNSTYTDDMDALSFSLHHLFHRVDFLYRDALPALEANTATTITVGLEQDLSLQDTLIRRQRIWRQLQAIDRALNRLEPICHLLSDAIEGIFDTLDAASDVFSFHVGIGSLADTPAAGFAQNKGRSYDPVSRYAIPVEPIDDERWDSAFSTVHQSLKSWQQSYRACTPFTMQFSDLNVTTGGLAVLEKDHAQKVPLDRLDAAFATLLDSACVIFGDILPAFRTSAANDYEGTATLLFDLIQQSDHLLVQLDATLEFLNGLIEDFILGPGPAISDESP